MVICVIVRYGTCLKLIISLKVHKFIQNILRKKITVLNTWETLPNIFVLLYYLHFKALTSTVRWPFKLFIIHDILLSYIHYNLLESFNNAWLQKAIPHNRYRYLNITPSIFYYFMKHSDNWTSNFVRNEVLLSSFKIIQNINLDSIK